MSTIRHPLVTLTLAIYRINVFTMLPKVSFDSDKHITSAFYGGFLIYGYPTISGERLLVEN